MCLMMSAYFVLFFLFNNAFLYILWFGWVIDSGSARYNAEQMAKTVQARIDSNKTSQSITSQCLSIYSREPNKRNSVYIGNMTWVSNV